MVRLNRRVGYNRDTYLLCRLCDRVVMIPEQVRRKLDAGQGHIVGQVAVYFPVEPVGQIRAAQVEAGSQRGKGQVLLQMQVDIVDDIADDHQIAGGCFTFYAPHDAKAAIKMFAQKGNSSIDEFPFCS